MHLTHIYTRIPIHFPVIQAMKNPIITFCKDVIIPNDSIAAPLVPDSALLSGPHIGHVISFLSLTGSFLYKSSD